MENERTGGGEQFHLDWTFDEVVEYVLYTTLLALRHSGRSVVQYQKDDAFARQRLRFELEKTFQHLRSSTSVHPFNGGPDRAFIDLLAEIIERMSEKLPAQMATNNRYATVRGLIENAVPECIEPEEENCHQAKPFSIFR